MTTVSAGTWEPVTEGVWRAVCQPAGVNAGLIVGDDAHILIDPGPHPRVGSELRNQAAQLTGTALRAVVLTHDHWDHWFGIGDMPDIDIIAHENFRTVDIGPEQVHAANDAGIDVVQLGRPTTSFSIAKAIDLGGTFVELMFLGHAHSACDIVVATHDGRAMFVGDLVEEGATPQLDETGSLDQWPGVLDQLSAVIRPRTKIVPGHGAVVDKSFVYHQRNQLMKVCTQAATAVKSGMPLARALQEFEWPWDDELMRKLVAGAYRELAERGLRPGLTLPLQPKTPPASV